MKHRPKKAAPNSDNAVTVYAPAKPRGGAPVCCPKRELAVGSGPHLTGETQDLLRGRLRAAALLLLIGFGAFLVRHVVGVMIDERFYPLLLTAHVAVVLVLGLVVSLLWLRNPVTLRKLRVAELVTFGLPALFFLLLQHRITLDDVARGFMPPPMSFWLLLIFTYGMFIPNTWRRAAWVIGAMALAPDLLVVGMMLAYPDVGAMVSGMDLTQHALTMLLAAIAAVFGTRLINRLRREAFEARQLGQYRLIASLGTGGMGEVYLAEHQMLKRPCAIKLIHPDKAGNPQVLARFELEVQMTARLSHWNTVEIFDYGRTEDGTFYYVMEYLPGLNLEDLLERHGPLPAERIVYLLRQVCQALREAHANGFIHRDIKPGNIFAAQRGGLFDVVKLLDFGLVKPLSDIASPRLTQDGTISGTPNFMSPEQASGNPDARSDIYSLGAVAYMLLTGRPPFERPTPMAVIVAHARDEVAPPSQIQADVPADLEDVLLRCLAKRPEDRFQDAESLEQALAGCAAADQWTQADAAAWWRGQSNETPREMNVVATM